MPSTNKSDNGAWQRPGLYHERRRDCAVRKKT
jgi:hypothetical protein